MNQHERNRLRKIADKHQDASEDIIEVLDYSIKKIVWEVTVWSWICLVSGFILGLMSGVYIASK